ncbi:hypothetical protein ACEQPO_09705 [Bacillus sp. SL00103]
MASSLFFSPVGNVLAAENYSEIDLVTAGLAYTGYVEGKHGYGRWTITAEDQKFREYNEKCPGSLEGQIGDRLKLDGAGSASTNVYLKGGCKYSSFA